MTWLLSAFQTSIGRKALVALTGLGLIGFVLVHMAGNLQVFLGQDALNAYAAGLHSLGGLLWAARIGLLLLALAHVALALKLAAENRAARGGNRHVSTPIRMGLAVRSMVPTGLLVAAFTVYHLAHFTWQTVHPEYSGRLDGLGRPDVYSMVVGSFGDPLVAGLYVAAMILLGLHLWHGAASISRSLGLDGPRSGPLFERAGRGLALIVVAGNCSMPLAVQFGLLALPPGVAR